MKLLRSLFYIVTVSAASLGAHAAPCSSGQLGTVDALTSDPALLSACPTVTSKNFLTDVAPCNDPGCVAFLTTQVSGRLPECEVDDGVSFKDLYAAFVSVCRENAAAGPQPTPTSTPSNTTANTTAVPPTNTTRTPLPTTVRPALNRTNTTGSSSGSGSGMGTRVTPTLPDPEAVGGSAKPVVPAPVPRSRAARLPSVEFGVGVVAFTAMAAAWTA